MDQKAVPLPNRQLYSVYRLVGGMGNLPCGKTAGERNRSEGYLQYADALRIPKSFLRSSAVLFSD